MSDDVPSGFAPFTPITVGHRTNIRPSAPSVKVCPFCGEHPNVREGDRGWVVECLNKACAIMPETHSTWYADDLWNRRAPTPATVSVDDVLRVYAALQRGMPVGAGDGGTYVLRDVSGAQLAAALTELAGRST